MPALRASFHKDPGGTLMKRPTKRSIRSFVIDQLRWKPLGVPAAVLARIAGATDVAKKISSMCGYVPPIVEVVLPEHLAHQGRFVMHGAGGLDPVARTLQWTCVKLGYERPFPDLFAACSRSSRLVVDVGSFSGFYSMIAATWHRRPRSLRLSHSLRRGACWKPIWRETGLTIVYTRSPWPSATMPAKGSSSCPRQQPA